MCKYVCTVSMCDGAARWMRMSISGDKSIVFNCEMHKRAKDRMASAYGPGRAIQGRNWPAGFRIQNNRA